jgi:hypothetical protein
VPLLNCVDFRKDLDTFEWCFSSNFGGRKEGMQIDCLRQCLILELSGCQKGGGCNLWEFKKLMLMASGQNESHEPSKSSLNNISFTKSKLLRDPVS